MHLIAASMAGAPIKIVERVLGHFSKVDPAYGAGIAERLCRNAEGKGR